MKRFFRILAKGLGLLLLAALALWFWPFLFGQKTDPELLAYYEEKRQKRRKYQLGRAYERWLRNENQTRSKQAWKNRNKFFKKGK